LSRSPDRRQVPAEIVARYQRESDFATATCGRRALSVGAVIDTGGNEMSRPNHDTRELAARESDGIHVLLLWHPRENEVTVEVDDVRTGAGFQLAVAPNSALDAFYHPFAYAA
jgi:hypothetical protein